MNGLEAVELKLSEIESGIRIDAELYQRHLVLFHRKLKQLTTTTLKKEALLVKKGIFDIRASSYVKTGVPFVRIGNLKSMLIDNTDIIYIPEEENEKNKETSLQRNDIILSKTANAAASLVNLDFCNTSQDTVAVKLDPDSKLLSHFLVVYLNTELGLKEMQRWFTGNIQMHLNLTDCKTKMLIPVLSLDFQKRIKELFEQSVGTSTQANDLYKQAEANLLDELGLQDWKPSDKNTQVRSFKTSFLKNGRLDAEYYQKKYDDLESEIMNTGQSIKLSSILRTNKRGTQPTYVDNDAGIPVLNSKHIRENRIEFSDIRMGDPNGTKSDLIIRKNDVLINGTGVGTIGRCAVYMKDEPALPDNHITILRTEIIDPVFLAVMLNSVIGKMQVEKYFKGSSGQIELYPTDINEFIIWKAPVDLQIEIRRRIEEAEKLRNQSMQLLDVAKKAVEIAIEQDETTALNFINKSKF